MDITTMSTEARFVEYVNIANQALAAKRDEFPFNALIDMSERLYGGQDIGIAVYEEDPREPENTFTIRLSDGEIEVVELGRTDEVVSEWAMPVAHLDDVVSDAGAYRKSPMRFDLSWVKRRVQGRIEAWGN